MKKIVLALTLLTLIGFGMQAQTVVTISDVQQPVNLQTCNDSSTYFGDTVTLHGIVVTDGGLAQAASGRNIWLQDGTGGWNGIDVFGFSTPSAPTDILDMKMGDSVAITGYIDNYQGETEIRPTSAIKLASNKTVTPNVVAACDLNDAQQNNNLIDGEKWEGCYVEIQNVSVVSVDFFSGGNRVSFVVQDQNGCRVNVSDRFLVQRLPANGGTFVPPTVGDQFCYIRGVLAHSKNNCTGFNGRGYEIQPFDTSNYSICSAAPSIFNVDRNITCPGSGDPVVISAELTDGDGIMSADLKWVDGANCTTGYQTVPMTNTSGNVWEGTIPAQVDGDFIRYYIEAADSQGNVGANPNVPTSDPNFFRVNDDGCTIYDIQFVPQCFSSKASGYNGMQVEFDGVVTASAEPNNLGTIFLQEENKLDWAGILVSGNPSLANIAIDDKVTIIGDVNESFGFTVVENVQSVTPNGTGSITPLTLNPSLFTAYDASLNEQYESMLITFKNPTSGEPVYVVEKSADAPNNFAEWRVGPDQFDPGNGSRVQTGRQTSSSLSSLNVSYVNDSMWMTLDGPMNVPVCVVNEGTTFDEITGIMYYSFSEYKMLPRNNSDFTGGFALQCPAVAIEDLIVTDGVTAYPNPAKDVIHLDYSFENTLKGNVQVIDLMGRTLKTVPFAGQEGTINIDLNDLSSGHYILSLNSNGTRVWHGHAVVTK